MKMCKQKEITTVIIGHVTKEGNIDSVNYAAETMFGLSENLIKKKWYIL